MAMPFPRSLSFLGVLSFCFLRFVCARASARVWIFDFDYFEGCFAPLDVFFMGLDLISWGYTGLPLSVRIFMSMRVCM